MTDIELVKQIIPLWYAQYAWAEELLKKSFGFETADEILTTEYRGSNQIPGTNWTYRTHGVGVDISRTSDVGGIDFDFDKPDPDEWRLFLLFEKQYNEGNLALDQYRHLADDEERLKLAIKEALK